MQNKQSTSWQIDISMYKLPEPFVCRPFSITPILLDPPLNYAVIANIWTQK